MEQVAPLGGVYQAGTLSGNPLAVAAGLATLRALATGDAYDRLEALGARLEQRAARGARRRPGVPLTVNRVGSMLTGVLLRGARDRLRRRARAPTPRATRASSTPCSSAACTWRRRSSRPRSSRSRTRDADLDVAARAAAEAMARCQA